MSEEVPTGGGLALQPRLSRGFLASLPLFCAYEVGLRLAGPGTVRNGAEVALTLGLSPLGDALALARVLALALLSTLFLWRLRRDEEPLEPVKLVGKDALEGTLLALLLGPLLLWMLHFFDVDLTAAARLLPAGGDRAPDLGHALRLAGGAPWEELSFRVLLLGAVHLVVARGAGFLGLGRGPSLAAAELVALLASSAAFAAFHLDAVQELLGRRGDPFEPTSFLWRLLAGLVLAGIYRWRGMGTAAWTHAVFNLALALGAGPAVFGRP